MTFSKKSIRDKNFIVANSIKERDRLEMAGFTMFHTLKNDDGSESFYFVNEPKKFEGMTQAEFETLDVFFTNMLGF